jgi:signal transduction histidine kinase
VVEAVAPGVRVEAADHAVVRVLPDADVIILAVGSSPHAAVTLVEETRLHGRPVPLIVVADHPAEISPEELQLFGTVHLVATAEFPERLPSLLSDILTREARWSETPDGRALQRALQRMQGFLLTGRLAGRLQHRLNNPLAALLAEAQLLELEPLAEEHLGAVRRIIELCRRLIDETRSIEGIGDVGPSEASE